MTATDKCQTCQFNARGRGYDHTPGSPETLMSQVGRGTAMGEYLRRFWQPVGLSTQATDLPRKVRILGEDLILFRDKAGRPGLLYPHCMHRGTNLFYGKVEDHGIRCCYHGWLFAVDGTCLEQPCEPDGGRNRDVAHQPWYPLQEKYGLVFAYMGPAGTEPQLPAFSNLDELGPDEVYEVDNGGYGGFGDSNAPSVVPCSWMQDFENIMDPFHVQVLHSTISGVQFSNKFIAMPKVEWQYTDNGMSYEAVRHLSDGRTLKRINSVILPNIAAVPTIDAEEGSAPGVSWYVPVDDENHMTYWVSRVHRSKAGNTFRGTPMFNGKFWTEMTEEEHQRFPGDAEAQIGQGAIPRHSEWHLATSDRGISMLRRLLKKEVEKVSAGGALVGELREEGAVLSVPSGNFYS
jgi:phenylpropionate dioxygenase-like ring-hydroxylating dioxygenase large terminal subunit